MKKIASIMIVSILLFSMVLIAPLIHAEATIWTDKADYAPGDTVVIYGSGFGPETVMTMGMARPDGSANDWSVTADSSGSFTTTYQLDGIQGIYSVVASDGTITASTTFTDTGTDFQYSYPYVPGPPPNTAFIGQLNPGQSTPWVEVTVTVGGTPTYPVYQTDGWQAEVTWSGGTALWPVAANPGPTYTWPDGTSTVVVQISVTVPADWTEQACYTFRVKLKPGYDSSVNPQGKPSPKTIGSGEGVHFKVCVNIPSPQTGSISGFKFDDSNANGVWDDGEVAVENWEVHLTGTADETAFTDANGKFVFDKLLPGTYTVTEVFPTPPPTWAATTATSFTHDLAGGEDYVGPDFGNIRLGSISGYKFYDANVNKVWDDGEVAIVGWKVHLTGTNILPPPNDNAVDEYALTDSDGKFTFDNLYPGSYTVTEILPPPCPRWIATTATSFDVVLGEGVNYVGPDFGNVCLEPGHGGLTLGYWTNKNGNPQITAEDRAYLGTLPLYSYKSTPPFANNAQIKAYLLNADASNMKYMLSAQLIATILNVRHGYLLPGTIVYVGNGNGFMTIGEIIDGAILALSNGTPRATQEYWKNLLDGLNNNRLPFVCSGPCYPIIYP